jgi:hypothetical protein
VITFENKILRKKVMRKKDYEKKKKTHIYSNKSGFTQIPVLNHLKSSKSIREILKITLILI